MKVYYDKKNKRVWLVGILRNTSSAKEQNITYSIYFINQKGDCTACSELLMLQDKERLQEELRQIAKTNGWRVIDVKKSGEMRRLWGIIAELTRLPKRRKVVVQKMLGESSQRGISFNQGLQLQETGGRA